MPEVSERMVKHFTGAFVKSKFSRELLKMIFSLGEQDVGLRFLQILGMSSRVGAEENNNIVQGFVSIMEYSSEWAKKWVLAVKSFYSSRSYAYNRSSVFVESYNFDEACVVGLFAGANRRNYFIDKEGEMIEEVLPDALAAIVFCPWKGGDTTKFFENNLSREVKAYFRETKIRKSARLSSAISLFERVRARMNPELGRGLMPENPSELGWVILNQIAYGVFGILHQDERLELLYSRYADLIPPKKKEATK